jgi:hypothetical protein
MAVNLRTALLLNEISREGTGPAVGKIRGIKREREFLVAGQETATPAGAATRPGMNRSSTVIRAIGPGKSPSNEL